jgi:predicted RNA-binding Zn-ribbon protein involved in translation (DUF1610 family)
MTLDVAIAFFVGMLVGCGVTILDLWYKKMLKLPRLCPKCHLSSMELIDKCIIYDKYYICRKCGYCDFSESIELSKAENERRVRGIFGDKHV